MADILLVYPGKREKAPRLPLSVLYLANALEKAGYKPNVLDTRLDSFEGIGGGDYLFAGISSMCGSQIRYGLEAARKIREDDPSLPIVWGGVHPSLVPDQTAENEFVDIVARGEGEETVVELARAIEGGKPLDGVKGLTYKQDGRLKRTADRGFIDFNTLGPLSYDYVQVSRYLDSKEYFSVQSSRGCPHDCIFCFNRCFNDRTWRAKTAKTLVDEVERIVERYGVKDFYFIDDNFFVDQRRVEAFCSLLGERNLDITWFPECRFDYFAGYSPEFIKKIRGAGCNKVFFGGESGSQRLLDYMHKGTTVEQITESVRKCRQFDIKPTVSFMIGWPTETADDVKKTLDLVDKIKSIHPGAEVNNLFFLGILPGTDILEIAKKHGYAEPQSLEEWQDWRLSPDDLPWLEGRRGELEAVSNISRFWYYHQRISSYSFEARKAQLGGRHMIWAYSVFHGIFDVSARYRWRRRFFKFPLEWKLWGLLRDRYMERV